MQHAASGSDDNSPPSIPQVTFDALQPNKAQAEAFLHWLDPSATEFCFQTFDDDGDRKSPGLTKVFHGGIDECWLRLTDLSHSVAEIEGVLTAAGQRAGLHHLEIATTIKSGLSAGMANPRRIGAAR